MAWPIPNPWSGVHPPPSNYHLHNYHHHHHAQPHPPLPQLLVVPIVTVPTQKKQRKSNHVMFQVANAPSASVPAPLQQGTRTHMNQGSRSVPVPSHDQILNQAPCAASTSTSASASSAASACAFCPLIAGYLSARFSGSNAPSHWRTLSMSDKLVPPRPVMPPKAVMAVARRNPTPAPAPAPAPASAPGTGTAPIIPSQHAHSHPYGLVHPHPHFHFHVHCPGYGAPPHSHPRHPRV